MLSKARFISVSFCLDTSHYTISGTMMSKFAVFKKILFLALFIRRLPFIGYRNNFAHLWKDEWFPDYQLMQILVIANWDIFLLSLSLSFSVLLAFLVIMNEFGLI